MKIDEIASMSYDIAKHRGQLEKHWLESLVDEVTELSKCVVPWDGVTPVNFESKHIPPFNETEEELADVILVCLTTLHSMNVDIEKLLTKKCKFNLSR